VLAARSLLTSALTGDAIDEIDSPEDDVALAIGDVVLLASDGLNTLDTADIAQTIERARESGAQAIANDLVAAVLARELQKQDNTTVITACIRGSGAPASADDEVPRAMPGPVPEERPRRRWHLTAGLVLLVAILASVIVTQML
jgi:serine/threonine protein phosphatase PrpC